MSTPLIVIHVIVSVFIIFLVLLQVGRGAEAGAVFGGTGQVHSSRGRTTFIGKVTAGLAVAFMLTSILLTYNTSTNAKSSVTEKVSQDELTVDEQTKTQDKAVTATPAQSTSEKSAAPTAKPPAKSTPASK